MATKTERILSYLPGTFQVIPKAEVLHAVVDAFGKELLSAENTLAEVMSSHWVDHADQGAEVIKDLQLLAALYGLAPRQDEDGNFLETVEEFRTHLKRYVRTFLEGTVTVQGILRVTAEALGLHIADDYKDLDTWWNRKKSELVTRRFVTRAAILDEAAPKVFGFLHRHAQGTAATPAQVVGIDLGRSINLQEKRFLRLSVDGEPAQEVDFATHPAIPRPRAATLKDIVAAINQTFGKEIAADNGKQLILVAQNSLTFLPPRGADAMSLLLTVEPGTFRGEDGTSATFVGTVDLSTGVTLPATAAIKLGKDGGGLVEISLSDAQTTTLTLSDIVEKINNQMGVFASHDGEHLILTSSQEGEASSIDFAIPSSTDATTAIFGIVAPRNYRGVNAKPAEVVGNKDLSNGVDLRVTRFLKLSAEAKPAIEIDCAPGLDNPVNVSLDTIVSAINNAITSVRATSRDDKYLTLTSTAVGNFARLELLPYITGDARATLMGEVPDITRGLHPQPAKITGEVDLLAPRNLQDRGIIRLSVDDQHLVDIDITGAVPEQTLLDEIIAKINAVFPGLATATPEDRLQLTSPTVGENSKLSLLPLRYLELIEYPPERRQTSVEVRHGDDFRVVHDGKNVDAIAQIQITAPNGAVGVTLVNQTLGWQIQLLTILSTSETARLWRDAWGLQVEITSPTGESRLLPGTDILVGPIGTQIWVPCPEPKPLHSDDQGASLQLNNPLAPNIVELRAIEKPGIIGNKITVTVTSSAQNLSTSDTNRYDVTLKFQPPGGEAIEETYTSVTIGGDSTQMDSLVWQINVTRPSQLVKAASLDKATVLTIPHGVSKWIYLDCYGSRFNQANFNQSDFPGRLCKQRGVFNVSHFVSQPPGLISAVFTAPDTLTEPPVQIDLHWQRHRLGAFNVNLPADLHPRFGGKFNQARFSSGKAVELYEKAVTEPPSDANYLVKLINEGNPNSTLVTASEVIQPFLGWQPVKMPFRKPQFLTLGRDIPTTGNDGFARLYLQEEGVNKLIELKAKFPGNWGNKIAVSVRQSGPAMYDIEISYNDSYFENATVVVLGGKELPTLTEDILKPGAIGILQAKAAGIQATVTRKEL